ncbi:peptide deformylase [bacterium SCSIO 12741]|nr:peptide deformylase [bacterium SCSIO 12741]
MASRTTVLLSITLLIWSGSLLAQKKSPLKKKERQLIESGNPNEPMRLWLTTNPKDSALLRKVAKPVNLEKDSNLIHYFHKRFLVTVKDPKNMGVGIAAPQVGLSRQMILVQRFDQEGSPFGFYLNPRILEYSDSTQLGKEGCLSIPNQTGMVFRAQEIVVEYLDLSGKKHMESVDGFTSVIFQHEIDHLNGILFTDHLNSEREKKIDPKSESR